jgi:hypothetical protein
LTGFLNVVKPKIKCVWNLTAALYQSKSLRGIFYLRNQVSRDDQKSFPFLMLEGVDPPPENRTYVESLCVKDLDPVLCIESCYRN